MVIQVLRLDIDDDNLFKVTLLEKVTLLKAYSPIVNFFQDFSDQPQSQHQISETPTFVLLPTYIRVNQ